MVRKDGADWHVCEDSNLFCQRHGTGFKMKLLELELSYLQARLQQVQVGIDSGFDALLLDPKQIALNAACCCAVASSGETVSSSM